MNNQNNTYADPTVDEIELALAHIDANLGRDEWARICMAIKSELGDSGFDVFDRWSSRGDNYSQRDTRDTWRSFKATGGVGIATLFKVARENGYRKDNSQPQKIDPQAAAERRARREADARREAEDMERRQLRAAADAQAMWEAAQPFAGHEYTDRKAITSPGQVRVGTYRRWIDDGMADIPGALLIPIRDAGGHITSMQAIFPDDDNALGRDRDYLPGGRKQGCYFNIGKPTGQPGELVMIGEGYATVASAHAAKGGVGVVAFDAGNLPEVAQIIRTKLPQACIVMLADNDRFKKANAGVLKSTEAARLVAGLVAIPQFSSDDGEPTDFNDLQVREGTDVVRAQIDAAQEPAQPAMAVPKPANDNGDTGFQWQRPLNIFAEFPAPPIRHDMLPAVIANYAEECGELIGVDPAMVAIPALVACASALHDDVKIQPKRFETGWTESARLWCAVVGSPSVRKTPAIKRATKRLRKIDHDLADDNARQQAAYSEQMEHFKEAKKEAKKMGQSIPEPKRPAMARMIVEDITVEALSEVLKDNTRGIMCIQDELSGWFGMMDAYTGGKAGNKDRAAWLQAYNGGFRQVDRVMRGSVHIPNFSVSMIGGIQPDAIRRIAKDMTDDGLMQRFIIVIGRNSRELDRMEDPVVSREYGELIERLHAVQGSGKPVTLSEDAHVIREGLMAYAGELADYPALPSGLRSHLGKWSGLFARLLLVYHAIECVERRVYPTEVEVSGETADQVDRLMRRFLLPHALAYYTDVLGASGDLEHARWVAGHILSKGLQSISNRDLVQAYKQWRGLDDWRRQRVMQLLEDMSWVAPVTDEGRPSKRGVTNWSVNPDVHGHFQQMAVEEGERRDRIRSEIAAMQSRN